MGGSGLYSLAQISLFEVGPVDKPSLMGALIGLTLAISYVLGPLLGGIISTTASWRWIFWLKYVLGCLETVFSTDSPFQRSFRRPTRCRVVLHLANDF